MKIFLINKFTILMMSAKFATPGLLKMKIFQNKGYEVIILDVTNKFYHVIQIIFRFGHATKVGNSSISIREVIIASIL